MLVQCASAGACARVGASRWEPAPASFTASRALPRGMVQVPPPLRGNRWCLLRRVLPLSCNSGASTSGRAAHLGLQGENSSPFGRRTPTRPSRHGDECGQSSSKDDLVQLPKQMSTDPKRVRPLDTNRTRPSHWPTRYLRTTHHPNSPWASKPFDEIRRRDLEATRAANLPHSSSLGRRRARLLSGHGQLVHGVLRSHRFWPSVKATASTQPISAWGRRFWSRAAGRAPRAPRIAAASPRTCDQVIAPRSPASKLPAM